MATFVFIVALVIEAALALYCIVTKSNQKDRRSIVRIGALAAFVIFTLLPVVRWSFRWYALAVLLLVWALLGALTLLRKREDTSTYRPERIVYKALGMLLLVAIALIPAFVFPQHKPPKVTGTHPVATSYFTYTDGSRVETFTDTGENRKLNVECWYPEDGTGRYPLVVFSHGALGIKASNTSTFTELASNGYVACSIDHPYHAVFTRGDDGHIVTVNREFMQGVVDVNSGKYDEATSYKLETQWMQLQAADISFVVDTLLAQARSDSADAAYRLIDPEKVGLMGHSLGGESSALVARERSDIDAVVNLDADLGGEYIGYADGRYVLNDTVFPVPILTILADDVVRLIAAIPDADNVVAVQHVSATAPQAYQVHLTGTDHQSVTDLPLVSPLLVSLITGVVPKADGGETADKRLVIERMNDLVLQFFDKYLKYKGAFAPATTY